MSRMKVAPLGGACGAIISGLDLSSDLDDHAIDSIRQVLLCHQVIFLRDQCLTREQHKEFGRRFGPLLVHPQYANLEGHPEILPVLKEAHAHENVGGVWHSDLSNLLTPPLGSILYAKEIPPFGGDTMFADMYAAYDTLSDNMKKRINGLRAIHGYEARFTRMGEGGKRPKLSSEQLAEVPEVVHPIVRMNAETGRKALYVNEGFTLGIEGLPMDEGRDLLDTLNSHAMQPDFVYSHNWRVGDLVFWDNRAVMHCATAYDTSYARTMHRTTIQGDIPI